MPLVCSIKKDFGDFALSADFSAEDEKTALLGASGSGKSMTLKCIAGIVKPDSGHIEVNGKVLFDSASRINLVPQKRHVGFLFQDYALFPNMTTLKNISLGVPKAEKANRDKIARQLISSFQLDGLENRFPSQLSGGQRQRCALARILAGNPEILMLDEPFSALDAFLRWQLEQELGVMLESFKKPVLYVSHNRDEVYRLCEKIVIMDRGVSGKPEKKWELFENPVTRSAAILTGCKNISPIRIESGKVEAISWGLVFRPSSIPRNAGFLGIRANYILPAAKAENPANYVFFDYEIIREIEDTFVCILLIKPAGVEAKEPIRWEIRKTDRPALETQPRKCCVLRSHMMLLADSNEEQSDEASEVRWKNVF
ncbi:MAG: ATP-binding cassette domain-containing protein [Clostridiales bacterium]|jgi:molybdate transport system ATP-binding protein|nr:ATP-binding cassette domain-containing protein [Clostridiales bacterium]